MQCPACGFENIPGTKACVRCRAQLVVTEPVAPEELVPPRAGRLKALRRLRYALTRLIDGLPRNTLGKLGRFFTGGAVLPGDAIAAGLLSIVPGLGHLAGGRPRAAAISLTGWLGLLALTANFYAGATGGLLLGLLIAWHAGVAFDAAKVHQHTDGIRERLTTMVFLFAVSAAGYVVLDAVVRRHVSMVVSPVAIPSVDVLVGDILLAWPGRFGPEDVRRGDVLVFRPNASGPLPIGGERYVHVHTGDIAVGRVVALAGSLVSVSPQGFDVDGEPVETRHLPEGRLPWPQEPFAFRIPNGCALIPLPLQLGRNERLFTQAIRAHLWQHVFVARLRDIRARAEGVYLPWTRRHSFRRSPQVQGETGESPLTMRADSR